MNLDSASQALLIIVSATLTVFLILLSIALGYFIRLIRKFNGLIEKAESVASSVESAAQSFEKSAGPISVLKYMSSVFSGTKNKGQGKDREDE
jgi:hypothetical protein